MLQLDKSISKPYYVQIYEYYRREIEERRMVAGMRLDSVRELAQAAGISKMTVEKAYYQLASEGYILRRHKARYEVASLGGLEPRPADAAAPVLCEASRRPVYAYDFASGDMALERFPLDIWRKYMNRILSEPDRLLAANDDQGVPDLRRALSRYVYETRGVHADPSQIIIGAGTISLLGVLTNLLHDKYTCIGVEDPGFRLGREIFRNSGYSIVPIPISGGLLHVDALEASGVRLVYVSPSHQFPTGTVMPAGIRHRLLRWAEKTDGLIIEDDYDSELRYYGRPVPALQGLDRQGRVVYMGALSKVLPFLSVSAIWSCRHRSCPSMSSGAACSARALRCRNNAYWLNISTAGNSPARSGDCARSIRKRGTVRETPGRSLWQRHRRRAPGFRRVLPYPPAQPSSGRRIAPPGGTARLSCLIHEVFLRNTVAGNG